jgi:deferrochelatase/peroxidase EfeB
MTTPDSTDDLPVTPALKLAGASAATAPPTAPSGLVSRRGLLGATGAGVVGAGIGLAAGVTAGADETSASPAAASKPSYPFYGEHQAGIATPIQDRLHFAAFDMVSTERADLVGLLQDWTAAAARMTQGRDAGPFGAVAGPYDAPPDDTGEAVDLPPAGLTLTFGFGPSLFRLAGRDRFGIADRRPAALRRLPHFPGDRLDPQRSDGDLCVQACADDPQVAVHAIRNLARIAMGRAALRWSQLGFGRTSSTSTSQVTPRNLFGFKDGTMNLKAEQPGLLDEHVWVPKGKAQEAWLTGGSYLVARRINMRIETWDRQPLREQEKVVGRTKAQGAPLSGGGEFTQPDFSVTDHQGQALVADESHVRLAHPEQNNGVQMLRRGYNFVDGNNSRGQLDAGLFFIAYVRDPRTHYIPIQTKIARDDGMSEYLQHTGSGLFAVPPGVPSGGYVGQGLFA